MLVAGMIDTNERNFATAKALYLHQQEATLSPTVQGQKKEACTLQCFARCATFEMLTELNWLMQQTKSCQGKGSVPAATKINLPPMLQLQKHADICACVQLILLNLALMTAMEHTLVQSAHQIWHIHQPDVVLVDQMHSQKVQNLPELYAFISRKTVVCAQFISNGSQTKVEGKWEQHSQYYWAAYAEPKRDLTGKRKACSCSSSCAESFCSVCNVCSLQHTRRQNPERTCTASGFQKEVTMTRSGVNWHCCAEGLCHACYTSSMQPKSAYVICKTKANCELPRLWQLAWRALNKNNTTSPCWEVTSGPQEFPNAHQKAKITDTYVMHDSTKANFEWCAACLLDFFVGCAGRHEGKLAFFLCSPTQTRLVCIINKVWQLTSLSSVVDSAGRCLNSWVANASMLVANLDGSSCILSKILHVKHMIKLAAVASFAMKYTSNMVSSCCILSNRQQVKQNQQFLHLVQNITCQT